MPARHSDYKQLALRGVHKHAKLAGVMSPAPNKNSIQKFNTKKLLTNTYLRFFTLDEGMNLFNEQRTKTGRNGVRRHKLGGEGGNIKVLYGGDFGQFCKQRASDLHNVIIGKKIGH